MPFYEFECTACKNTFDHMTSISNRDEKIPCPHCGSKKTGRKLSVVAVGAAAGAKSSAAPGGHTHSSMCGCGKPTGSCGMN